MASLHIDLLGDLSLRLASGTAVVLPTRKSRLLVAYLALSRGNPQPRTKLMGLLWSDRAEPQARASLRQELHTIRHSLAPIVPPALQIAGEAVALDTELVEVDALGFERLAGRSEKHDLSAPLRSIAEI